VSHPPRAPRAYRVVARVVRPILAAVSRTDWHGAEHLPTERGFVVAANHVTQLDPVTAAHFLYDNGVVPRILAKASLWKVPVVGRVLKATAQIPVERNSAAAAEALAAAAGALEGGECVVVFPEGTLTREPDAWPMQGRTGVARLALTAQVPVIPVAQWGAHRVLSRHGRPHLLPPREVISVLAGPPVDLSDLYDRPQDTAVLREATERVMAAITSQLEELRGERAPAERFPNKRGAPLPKEVR
jgi:1-acyl-sn-glycerol-3-phosphate acyltransferase